MSAKTASPLMGFELRTIVPVIDTASNMLIDHDLSYIFTILKKINKRAVDGLSNTTIYMSSDYIIDIPLPLP